MILSRSLESVLLERSHESKLVGACLEATMTKLGAGIDELEVDLLGETLAGQSKQRLEKKKILLVPITIAKERF